MFENPRRESPLVGRTSRDGLRCPWTAGSVSLVESPFRIHLNLRADPRDSLFRSAIEAAVECPLPLIPNTFLVREQRRVYWLGPDEWLVVGPPNDHSPIHGALQSVLAGRHAALTEVGHGQTIFRFTGPGSRDLLARGCPLDLHSRAFGVGQCAQTRFAKAPVMVALDDAAPIFDLVVRRSFAEYLWDALVDAGAALS